MRLSESEKANRQSDAPLREQEPQLGSLQRLTLPGPAAVLVPARFRLSPVSVQVE